MTTFALSVGDEKSSKETQALRVACLNYPEKYAIQYFRKSQDVPAGCVPAGSIDWVESVLGQTIPPDYYPSWSEAIWNRQIGYCDTWPMIKDLFVKPADKHKRFKARITTGTYKGKKKGPLVWSTTVAFEPDEWRLYVSHGTIQYIGWYSEYDKEDRNFPPEFIHQIQQLNCPPSYCGAVDIGIVKGACTLVECNAPYSCGWYGTLSEGHIYADWLINGWNYLTSMYTISQEGTV